jgi:hypothetical protein
LQPASSDHHVGADEQRRRHCEAEGLGGLEVDTELEFWWVFRAAADAASPDSWDMIANVLHEALGEEPDAAA